MTEVEGYSVMLCYTPFIITICSIFHIPGVLKVKSFPLYWSLTVTVVTDFFISLFLLLQKKKLGF